MISTGGSFGDVFVATTARITAFSSLERCLCVVFPLKIKTIDKRPICILVAIFILNALPQTTIQFSIYTVYTKVDAKRNRSLLGVRYANSPLTAVLHDMKRMFRLIFMNIVPLLIILVCSLTLAFHLKRNAAWRRGQSTVKSHNQGTCSTTDTQNHSKFPKDLRVARTVLAIATTFILLGAVSSGRFVVGLAVTEFSPMGTYGRYFKVVGRLGVFTFHGEFNVNFVIYYKMGSNFRRTVKQIFFSNEEHSVTDNNSTSQTC